MESARAGARPLRSEPMLREVRELLFQRGSSRRLQRLERMERVARVWVNGRPIGTTPGRGDPDQVGHLYETYD